MFCPNCKKECENDLKYCPNCGIELHPTPQQPQTTPYPNELKPPNPSDKIKLQWFLQPAFIAVFFALSYFIVPFFVGLILLGFYYKKINVIKKEYQTIDETINTAFQYKINIEAQCNLLQRKTDEDVNNKTVALKNLEQEVFHKRQVLLEEISALKKECISLESQVFQQDINAPENDKITSEEYRDKYSLLLLKEKELIDSGKAVATNRSDNKKLITNNVKQILRCFNSETSTIIGAVTEKNVATQRNRLQRAFETLNKIYDVDGVKLNKAFYELKLRQLNMMYQYELTKAREKEEQKAIREQMLEEEKVRREIEKEKLKIDKEETQFKNEISKLMGYLQKADTVEKQLYIDKIRDLEVKLKLLEKDKENVLQREQNTRAGFVYIISNVGSFGDNVYKIGMTRRLEPMDRVKELGSASVPFEFDVHAIIFSEDAPTLESALHNHFREQAVNRVNSRKEFFKVSLQEIEKVVKENHNATVNFTLIAEAAQYRQSLTLMQQVS